MRLFVTGCILSCFVMLVGFVPAKVSVLGVYDRDSVLIVMPEYKNALFNCSARNFEVSNQLDTINKERARKASEMEQYKSKWSPLMLALKNKELADLDSNIVHYKKEMYLDSMMYRYEQMIPVNQKLNTTCENLKTEQKYDAVMPKNEVDSYKTLHPGEYKLVDVTGLLVEKLKQ